MRKLKLKRKSLEELSKVMPVLDSATQDGIVGGGSGTYFDPYSQTEFMQICTTGYFSGGYVDTPEGVMWYGGNGSGYYWDPGTSSTQNHSEQDDSSNLISRFSLAFGVSEEFVKNNCPNAHFRITNSFGEVDIVFRDHSISNQYCNASKDCFKGKVFKTADSVHSLGRLLGAIGLLPDVGVLIDSAASKADKCYAFIDLVYGGVSLVLDAGGVGLACNIAWAAAVGPAIHEWCDNHIE